MLTQAVCTLALGLAGTMPLPPGPGDTTVIDRTVSRPAPPCLPVDSLQQRRRSIEVSEWYSRRFTIHRWGAFTMMPLFGAQYLAGRQLWDKSSNAPQWAKTTHRVGATGLLGVFTVNTVTGLWNLWDSRAVEQGRTLRYVHALSMLAADAGFTYAGAKLSNEAETSQDKRSQHRTVALTSVGISLGSGLMMKFLNK